MGREGGREGDGRDGIVRVSRRERGRRGGSTSKHGHYMHAPFPHSPLSFLSRLLSYLLTSSPDLWLSKNVMSCSTSDRKRAVLRRTARRSPM